MLSAAVVEVGTEGNLKPLSSNTAPTAFLTSSSVMKLIIVHIRKSNTKFYEVDLCIQKLSVNSPDSSYCSISCISTAILTHVYVDSVQPPQFKFSEATCAFLLPVCNAEAAQTDVFSIPVM